MERIKLSENLDISRIIHGVMRLSSWNMNDKEIIGFVEECLELGIDSFDHADIYGGYTCEEIFGQALSQVPKLNNSLKIITKCGIQLVTENRPSTYIKHYNTTYNHIVSSTERSLKNLRRERIDLLLIHRPDPLMDPEEIAKAFDQLKSAGKVLEFGVSNFLPGQFDNLQSYLDVKLVTNQIEVSVAAIDSFHNGTIDHCQKHRIKPLVWSPLAGGAVFSAETQRFLTLKNVLHRIAKSHDTSIDQIMYQWLLTHPVTLAPIVGSGKIERLKAAVNAMSIELTRQQWFEIWVATTGSNVP